MKKSIQQLAAGQHTLAELQDQKNLRDAEVKALRSEMEQIQELMEPLWLREQALAAAPINLRQMLGGGQ